MDTLADDCVAALFECLLRDNSLWSIQAMTRLSLVNTKFHSVYLDVVHHAHPCIEVDLTVVDWYQRNNPYDLSQVVQMTNDFPLKETPKLRLQFSLDSTRNRVCQVITHVVCGKSFRFQLDTKMLCRAAVANSVAASPFPEDGFRESLSRYGTAAVTLVNNEAIYLMVNKQFHVKHARDDKRVDAVTMGGPMLRTFLAYPPPAQERPAAREQHRRPRRAASCASRALTTTILKMDRLTNLDGELASKKRKGSSLASNDARFVRKEEWMSNHKKAKERARTRMTRRGRDLDEFIV